LNHAIKCEYFGRGLGIGVDEKTHSSNTDTQIGIFNFFPLDVGFFALAFFFLFYNKGENVLKNNFQLKNFQAHRANWIKTKFGNRIKMFSRMLFIFQNFLEF